MGAAYQEIDTCIYQSKNIGSSKQFEMMGCDCSRHAPSGPLCTDLTDCVNRLTNIECFGNTSCHERCTNRRFQNKEFASVEVFDAGAKGQGVKTNQALEEGQFVYEYIGEVIDKPRFERRKVLYEKEGVQHFYFMMLQKDEFIDATKKGSVARFLNHSCNPNCAVTKWVVGPKLRMGIFTLRDIPPGEELTFDYNAERFGDNVQQCLCGEPNCRGILNGKTDAIDLIPRSLWPMLGLSIEVCDELREVCKADKMLKRKKELDSDIVDLIPVEPIENVKEIQSIVTFLLQPQERFLVAKILQRIYATNDQSIQSELLKMHGYELFGSLLTQFGEYPEMTLEMLQTVEKWPRLTRNKISSSRIESVVEGLAKSEKQQVAETAKNLLKAWSELEMAYRIPRQRRELKDDASSTPELSAAEQGPPAQPSEDEVRTRAVPPTKLPPGWEYNYSDNNIYYYNHELGITQWEPPLDAREQEREERRRQERDEKRRAELQREFELQKQEKERQAAEVQRIIDAAKAAETPTVEESEPAEEAPRPPKKQLTKEEHLSRKFTHLFATYVPKQVFKYEKELDHDKCKKHAREIVRILVEKEIRKGSEDLELSDMKKKKVKGFINEYIKKVIDHQSRKRSKDEEPTQKRVKTV